MHFWSCFYDISCGLFFFGHYLRSQILTFKVLLYSSLLIANIDATVISWKTDGICQVLYTFFKFSKHLSFIIRRWWNELIQFIFTHLLSTCGLYYPMSESAVVIWNHCGLLAYNIANLFHLIHYLINVLFFHEWLYCG